METKNNIYIVTELFSHGDLFDYIKKKKFLEGKNFLLVNISRNRSQKSHDPTCSGYRLHPSSWNCPS